MVPHPRPVRHAPPAPAPGRDQGERPRPHRGILPACSGGPVGGRPTRAGV